YGRSNWGRLMAFLFVWQILISGPLEVGSGLVAAAQFSTAVDPGFKEFDDRHTLKREIELDEDKSVTVSLGPSRLVGFGLGLLILALLYRKVTDLGRLSVAFLLGVLALLGWVVIEGAWHFDPGRAFDTATKPDAFGLALGAGMGFAIYSYLG